MKWQAHKFLLCRQVNASSEHTHRRHGLRQLDGEFHLGGSRFFQRIAVGIGHDGSGDGEGAHIGADNFQRVSRAEFVVQAAHRQSVFVAGFYLRHDLPLPDVPGGSYVLPRFAVIEAGGVDAVGNVIHLIPPDGVKHPASGFYYTPGLGKNEVRIAYVLKISDLQKAMEILSVALKTYPGKTL